MFVSNDVFRSRAATHIVSLGNRCAVAHNLRRYFNFGGAYPFDWWVVDGDGLAAFLEEISTDSSDKLYSDDRLEMALEGQTIKNLDFGFYFHHEFPRAKQPGKPIRSDWRNHVAAASQRTRALIKKFLDLNSPQFRVAFVRDSYAPEDRVISALSTLFPLAEWTLYNLNVQDEQKKYGWTGNEAAWDEALSVLNLDLDRTLHKPFGEIASKAS